MQQEYEKYDMEYLVSQYEMMQEVYSYPDAFGKERLLKLHAAFDSFDMDGNGYLEKNEIQDLLVKHWHESGITKQPSQKDLDEFWTMLDLDGNGKVEFEEFKVFMLKIMKQQIVKPLEDFLKSQGFAL